MIVGVLAGDERLGATIGTGSVQVRGGSERIVIPMPRSDWLSGARRTA